jgi:hypothetical protein
VPRNSTTLPQRSGGAFSCVRLPAVFAEFRAGDRGTLQRAAGTPCTAATFLLHAHVR